LGGEWLQVIAASMAHKSAGWSFWIVPEKEEGTGGGVLSAAIKCVLPTKLTEITSFFSELTNIQ
jgi:hypothetical protein